MMETKRRVIVTTTRNTKIVWNPRRSQPYNIVVPGVRCWREGKYFVVSWGHIHYGGETYGGKIVFSKKEDAEKLIKHLIRISK